MSLTLGSLTLDINPYISTTYDYVATDNGKIIGSSKKMTLNGTIQESGGPTALLNKISEFRSWYANNNNRMLEGVIIEGVTYSYLTIESFSIDPKELVNTISYTIVLVAQETKALLPSISGILITDNVISASISESLNIEAAAESTYFAAKGGLLTINNSVQWSAKFSIRCKRDLNNTSIKKAEDVIKRILFSTPQRVQFNAYKEWIPYLQSRKITEKPSSGSVDLEISVLLVPPQISQILAQASISASRDYNYLDLSHSKTMTVSLDGLVSVSWSDIASISNSCSYSKFANAKAAADLIKAQYNGQGDVPGGSNSFDQLDCTLPCAPMSMTLCYRPKTLTIAQSKVDGKVDLTMEWASSSDNCNGSGITIETDITTTTADYVIAVHDGMFTMPHSIIQNMNCSKAMTKICTITASSIFKCVNNNTRSAARDVASGYNSSYFTSLVGGTWSLIKWSENQTNTSHTITKEFIKSCP